MNFSPGIALREGRAPSFAVPDGAEDVADGLTRLGAHDTGSHTTPLGLSPRHLT